MEDVFVARQPIFDKNKHIYAYELLFRNGTANHVPDIDGDEATTTLLANTFFTIGMDTLAGGKNCSLIIPRTFWKRKSLSCCPKKPP
jgi:EAL and modified HD-GYP domain-containing signal transduction protein